MKAVIYHSYDDVRVEEVPLPEIGPGELLLHPAGCGLCGSDIAKIIGQVSPPVILGHELAGRVAAVGAGVTAFRPGERVMVSHHAPCGACHACRHGHPSMCPVFRASNIAPSGFAEFVRVPADLVQQTTLRLPDHLSDEEASFTEPLACCVRAVQRSALQAGDTVVVVGLGSIGLQMAQAVKALTEDVQVIGLDVILDRVILGHKLGIDRALHPGTPDLKERIDDWTDGQGVDVVILTAGGVPALTQAIDLLCPGGLLNVFAWPPGVVAPVPLEKLYHCEMTLTTSYSASPADLRTSLELLSSGKVRVDGLISHRLHFEQFHEGVELARKQQALKVFFVNPSYQQQDEPSASRTIRCDQQK